jgi:hypothetical protein
MTLVHALATVNRINSDLFPQWRFVNQILLLARQIIFRMLKKDERFLVDFALVREIDVRALVLPSHPKNIRTSARNRCSRP